MGISIVNPIMLTMIILNVMIASFTQSTPIMDTKTSGSSITVPILPAPNNINDCISSNYCNMGDCVLIDYVNFDGNDTLSNRLSCKCFPPYVDSQEGRCSVQGKLKKTAFLLSLLLGYTGADWFYLSAFSTDFIVIGAVKLILFLFPFFILGCW